MEIARYDDRVEISNTGSLTAGISIQELKKEHKSVLRNPLIANVFFYMEILKNGDEEQLI